MAAVDVGTGVSNEAHPRSYALERPDAARYAAPDASEPTAARWPTPVPPSMGAWAGGSPGPLYDDPEPTLTDAPTQPPDTDTPVPPTPEPTLTDAPTQPPDTDTPVPPHVRADAYRCTYPTSRYRYARADGHGYAHRHLDTHRKPHAHSHTNHHTHTNGRTERDHRAHRHTLAGDPLSELCSI